MVENNVYISDLEKQNLELMSEIQLLKDVMVDYDEIKKSKIDCYKYTLYQVLEELFYLKKVNHRNMGLLQETPVSEAECESSTKLFIDNLTKSVMDDVSQDTCTVDDCNEYVSSKIEEVCDTIKSKFKLSLDI